MKGKPDICNKINESSDVTPNWGTAAPMGIAGAAGVLDCITVSNDK